MPRIGLTFPVLNQANLFDGAITSLRERWADPPDYELMLAVVNNGSAEDVAAVARKHGSFFKETHYAAHMHNIGVARAWNDGISQCLQRGCDSVMVCNTDIVFGYRVIEHCYAALQRGAMAVFPFTYRQGGALPDDFDGYAMKCAAADPDGAHNIVTGGFAGWCFMLSRECLDRFGLFDPELCFWYQDTQYHWTLTHAGHPPVEVRSCCVHHYESQTIQALPGRFDYQGWREQDAERFEEWKRGIETEK